MSTTYLRTAAALLTALSLSAAPASAQRRHPGGGDRPAGSQDGGNRAQPRSQGEQRRAEGGGQRQAQPRREARAEGRRAEGNRDSGRAGGRDNRRADGRDHGRAVPRYDGRHDGRRDDRRVVVVRPRVAVPQYRYRPFPRRSYVVPYGYRPYGYRPGWSLNMYFGRPYVGGYFTDHAYGYYSLAPGFAYGSLRIVDAPRDARVYVDGYYAGVVDDYDGVFQHLNLEPGAHHIEIEIDPGIEPIAFDVRIEPGQTVTFHARDYY
jgi:hypothetical protein